MWLTAIAGLDWHLSDCFLYQRTHPYDPLSASRTGYVVVRFEASLGRMSLIRSDWCLTSPYPREIRISLMRERTV